MQEAHFKMTNHGKYGCALREHVIISNTQMKFHRQRDVSERELICEAQEFAVEGGTDLVLQEKEVILCAGLTNICIRTIFSRLSRIRESCQAKPVLN